MNRKRQLFAILFAGIAMTAAVAVADSPEKPKGDLAKLQGTWLAKMGPNKQIDSEIVIKDKNLVFSLTTPDGRKFEIKGEIKLDETAKPYKSVDWVKFASPSGDELPENLGIYEFEGDDKVKFCNGGPDNPRPKDFTPGASGPPNLVEMTRKKEPTK